MMRLLLVPLLLLAAPAWASNCETTREIYREAMQMRVDGVSTMRAEGEMSARFEDFDLVVWSLMQAYDQEPTDPDQWAARHYNECVSRESARGDCERLKLAANNVIVARMEGKPQSSVEGLFDQFPRLQSEIATIISTAWDMPIQKDPSKRWRVIEIVQDTAYKHCMKGGFR